ncbi:period circadian protein homolog 1 [Ambystoma mexicanum]|uniref:period circadian protein homolog 1 n=1 Tax=Ambystoma mexicanum TaxID=8296 RepID=UPI0037E738AC
MSVSCETGSAHAELAGHFEVSNGGTGPPSSGRRPRPPREVVVEQQSQSNDDTDANGSSGNESNGHESNGNESNGAESRGRDSRSSHSSTSGNGKDSALLETTESNKSTNSQSPSPPSSSIAYSLLSASSEQDNPSTSGCSSEQSAREKTQKELMKALKELKIRLPSEKRGKGKSGTLATLQYALSCVKQVRANQEYYQQWTVDDSQPCCLDMSSYTIEELENITSEFTLKNPDTFSVAVSFITGKIVYISDQADFILRCKRDVFKGATFAEFLAPQDVSVFYGSTAPFHLPSWSACTSADAAPMDYTQEKSVFCRISGGRGRDHELRYYPFRLTPYLTKVRDSDNAEGQPCCLLIAERVHSGYEAPRIPADKRIFTTRHTPSCMFQEVDERAVPLLGYLPQDLIGMPVLFFVHPEDRPLMLAIHKKILQYAGQPFDHSPIRFCARNGEYVTIDTSWSSFVNPWSRKVSFILGRHKVRTGPLNEDVFTAPKGSEMKPLDPDVQELSEHIHRILLQPVHSTNPMGNGSGGSNASHDHLRSNASSSDGNGLPVEDLKALKPMTFQQFYQDVHTVKHQSQQIFIDSRVTMPPQNPPMPVLAPPKPIVTQSMASRKETTISLGKAVTSEESLRKEPSNYSYQQINCLDSIIRYLESCNIPCTVKRKCGSSSYTTSSASDDDKQKAVKEATGTKKDSTEEGLAATDSPSKRQDPETSAAAVVGAPLTPLALPSKAESVVSITSQCSFSSTIVHVGDKKPPESDIVMMEETPSTPVPAPPPTPSVAQDKDQYRKVGLTKEVLSIHTQKEEQAFLTRFKDLSQLRVFDPPTGLGRQEARHSGQHADKGHRGSRYNGNGSGGQGSSRRGKSGKSKPKRLKHQKPSESTASPPNANSQHPAVGMASSSWPPSGTSQASLPTMPYPTVMPGYSIPMFPTRTSMTPVSEPNQGAFNGTQNSQGMRYPLATPQYPAPLVTPMVALVLPNYMFPQMNNGLPQPFFSSQSSFGGPMFPFNPPLPPPVQPQSGPMPTPTEAVHPASRSTTPHSMSQPDGSESPLFESRCSSPLQLNLLQMEETPKSSDRLEGGGASNQGGGTGSNADWNGTSTGQVAGGNDVNQTEACMVEVHESSNNDALSSSSDLLDLLLQEDSRSGTGSAASGSGSAASGSMGSGSNGGSTSACGTRSSSSNTSKYFGSIDSSENDHSGKKQVGVMKEDERMLIKYVMQDPIWLLMANADEKVMMSYQIPTRDMDKVLQEDREKLKQMHRFQPKFSDDQKRELAEVHPWMKKGLLPKAIDITACAGCSSSPYDYDIDMTMMLEAMEEGGCGPSQGSTFPPASEVAMEEEEAGHKPGGSQQQQQGNS